MHINDNKETIKYEFVSNKKCIYSLILKNLKTPQKEKKKKREEEEILVTKTKKNYIYAMYILCIFKILRIRTYKYIYIYIFMNMYNVYKSSYIEIQLMDVFQALKNPTVIVQIADGLQFGHHHIQLHVGVDLQQILVTNTTSTLAKINSPPLNLTSKKT